MRRLYEWVSAEIRRISKDEIFVYAAQASFYIITASIPFLMLLMESLKFFIPVTRIEAIEFIKAFVPNALKNFIGIVVNEVYPKSATVLSLTGITAVWSASRGIAAIERGMKKVYKTKKKRIFFVDAAFSLLYTILFVAALVVTLLVIVFGGTIFGFLSKHIGWFSYFAGITTLLKNFMYFFIMFVFFTFMYKVFAGKGASLGEQTFGALLATLGWFLFSFLFSVYVEVFSKHSYIYGSLTVIVFMMLWLYSCMIILLLGAEINVYFKNQREAKKG